MERGPGVGTVVVAQKYSHGLDRLMGLAETLHEHGRVTNVVRTMGSVAAPGPVVTATRRPTTRAPLTGIECFQINALVTLPCLKGGESHERHAPGRAGPPDLSYTGRAQFLLPLWIALRSTVREVLEGVSLADAASTQLPPGVSALTDAPDAWVNP